MAKVEQTTDVLVCVHRKGDRLYLGSIKPQIGMPIYNSIDGQGKITKINKRSVLVESDSHIERFAVRSARPHIYLKDAQKFGFKPNRSK